MGYLFLRAELTREVLGFFFQILLNFEWIPVEVHEEFETQPIWRFGVGRTLGLGLGQTEEMGLEKMGIYPS